MTDQEPPTQSAQFVSNLLEPNSLESIVKRTRTFVLRLTIDAQGTLRGAVSEPGSEDEWRSTFVSLDDFCSTLGERLCVKNNGL